ncbi:MAG: SPW repeat protein [Bacillota bacterium]
MTTFHVIHIIAGAWLIISPYLNIFDTRNLMVNSAVIGAVVLLYNLWFLFARTNVDVRPER